MRVYARAILSIDTEVSCLKNFNNNIYQHGLALSIVGLELLLQGKRCGKLVCLRSMNEEDAVPYVRWLSDPEVATIVEVSRVPSVSERVKQLGLKKNM